MSPSAEENGGAKTRWDERASRYDRWYETFKGAVEHRVDWELLRRHLPEYRDATILDAAGGTGRLTLPLAELGYSVTLCDISPGMLAAARSKLEERELSARVRVIECDVAELPLADESFDFVLCWGGGSRALPELARVARPGATISTCTAWRLGVALERFAAHPEEALDLLTSAKDSVLDDGEEHRVVDETALRAELHAVGIELSAIYAYDLWTSLRLPDSVLESRDWDPRLLEQTTRAMTLLATEPSVRGAARHLTVYGRKK